MCPVSPKIAVFTPRWSSLVRVCFVVLYFCGLIFIILVIVFTFLFFCSHFQTTSARFVFSVSQRSSFPPSPFGVSFLLSLLAMLFQVIKRDSLEAVPCRSHYPVSNISRLHCLPSMIWSSTNATTMLLVRSLLDSVGRSRSLGALAVALTFILGIRVCGQSFRVVWQRLCRMMIVVRAMFTCIQPPHMRETFMRADDQCNSFS